MPDADCLVVRIIFERWKRKSSSSVSAAAVGCTLAPRFERRTCDNNLLQVSIEARRWSTSYLTTRESIVDRVTPAQYCSIIVVTLWVAYRSDDGEHEKGAGCVWWSAVARSLRWGLYTQQFGWLSYSSAAETTNEAHALIQFLQLSVGGEYGSFTNDEYEIRTNGSNVSDMNEIYNRSIKIEGLSRERWCSFSSACRPRLCHLFHLLNTSVEKWKYDVTGKFKGMQVSFTPGIFMVE